ncbi:diguanylate cyclase, partial [Corallococcus exiguus]|nr:diguanylate cyclase [Corallococcus exiguus]
PFDRDRYRAALDAVIEQRRGRLSQDFRLRSSSGSHVWYRLKARPIVGTDGEVIRIGGTLTDVTDARTSEERLLYDAVHDNLTSLPNRQLLYDRLEAALTFASQDSNLRPTVLVIDLDKFKQTNDSVGHSAGDSILLTLSRRLGRLLRPQDTLARVSGDEFAIILLSEREPDRIIAFAEMVRRTLTTPITYAEREIFLTASIGLVLHDPQSAARREEVIRNAEIAVAYAKRQGGDRIEVFRPTMRSDRSDRFTLEMDLRHAIG